MQNQRKHDRKHKDFLPHHKTPSLSLMFQLQIFIYILPTQIYKHVNVILHKSQNYFVIELLPWFAIPDISL